MDDADPISRPLPLAVAASVLAAVAGALLLASQITYIETSNSFAEGAFDGTQLSDRPLVMIGVVWPIVALALAIVAGLTRSAVAVSVGVGLLVLTASYGVTLLAGFVEEFGLGSTNGGPVIRSAILLIGFLSLAVIAMAIWWVFMLTRGRNVLADLVPLRVVGMLAFVVSLATSIISLRELAQDVDIPWWTYLTASIVALIGVVGFLDGTRPGLSLAAAVAAGRFAGTFDAVVIRNVPFDIVTESAIDKAGLVALVIVLVCASVGLLPPFSVMWSRARSLRSRFQLADEWDD